MLLAFHKPYGVVSQFTGEGPANRTLAEFGFPKKVYPIGRLDADSEGLLLLSDEPEWNERLLHPRHAHEREYWAQVERIPAREALDKLQRGVSIQGRKTLPCRAWILEPQPGQASLSMKLGSEDGPLTPSLSPKGEREKTSLSPSQAASLPSHPLRPPPACRAEASERRPVPSPLPSDGRGEGQVRAPFHSTFDVRCSMFDVPGFIGRDGVKGAPKILPRQPPIRFRKNVPDCWIGLELIEGKNRQVRRMTAAIGHPTLRLIRVRIGNVRLADLPPGQWRVLPPESI